MPAGQDNHLPRPSHTNFTGCILPWTHTFCFPVIVYLSSTVCHVYYRSIKKKSIMVASRQFFNLIKLTFLRVYPSLKLLSNHLVIWHSFPDIKVNYNGLQLAILNLIQLTFFRAYPWLKPYILFYCFMLMIWLSGLVCQISHHTY